MFYSGVFSLSPDNSLCEPFSFNVSILFSTYLFRNYFHNQNIQSPVHLSIIYLVSFRLPPVLFPIRLFAIFLDFVQSFLLQHIFSAFHSWVFPLQLIFRQSLFSLLNILFNHIVSIISRIFLFSLLHYFQSPSLFCFGVFIAKVFLQYIFPAAYFSSRDIYYFFSTFCNIFMYTFQLPFTFVYA